MGVLRLLRPRQVLVVHRGHLVGSLGMRRTQRWGLGESKELHRNQRSVTCATVTKCPSCTGIPKGSPCVAATVFKFRTIVSGAPRQRTSPRATNTHTHTHTDGDRRFSLRRPLGGGASSAVVDFSPPARSTRPLAFKGEWEQVGPTHRPPRTPAPPRCTKPIQRITTAGITTTLTVGTRNRRRRRAR